MLLPHKHVRFGSSLIAIAGFARDFLHEPRSIDELWALLDSDVRKNLINPTFTQLVLAIDILFSIGVAKSAADGRITLVERSTAQQSVPAGPRGT